MCSLFPLCPPRSAERTIIPDRSRDPANRRPPRGSAGDANASPNCRPVRTDEPGVPPAPAMRVRARARGDPDLALRAQDHTGQPGMRPDACGSISCDAITWPASDRLVWCRGYEVTESRRPARPVGSRHGSHRRVTNFAPRGEFSPYGGFFLRRQPSLGVTPTAYLPAGVAGAGESLRMGKSAPSEATHYYEAAA